MSWNKIILQLMTPERKVVDRSVDKLIAEAGNGSFCIKPRHIDFLAGLVPGIFSYFTGEEEHLLAVSNGILVKKGEKVTVSVRHAIEGESLEMLETVVRKQFRILAEKEKETQIAIEKIQADFIQRFVELQKR